MAETECRDKYCPMHMGFVTHGSKFEAIVVSDKMRRSAVVERQYAKHAPKYERYEMRTTRITAHNPDCIKAKPGDIVIVKGCRPISKTKAFVIVKKAVK